MPPKISVILTVHNDARHIHESVQTVLDQTYPEFELIVVDDGSTDGTADLVGLIKDDRIRLLQPGRIGRGRALNLGIAESKGELIAIQDSDDLSHPSRLEVQTRILNQMPIELLGSTALLLEDDSPPIWPAVDGLLPAPVDVTNELMMSNPIPHVSLMIRRTLLDEAGGYNDMRKSSFDYDLFIRIAEKGYRLYRLPVALAGKRIHLRQHFEKGFRISYVLEMLRLQRKAISILKGRPWLVAALPLLFCYRMLPRALRMAVQKRRTQYRTAT